MADNTNTSHKLINFNFLRKSRIFFTDALNDTFAYLASRYSQSNIVLTKASPFMQVTYILHELFNMAMVYVDDALNEQNMVRAQRPSSIYGISKLSGHNPTRAQCAKGELQIQFKPGVENIIQGSLISINNHTTIKNINNNLLYTVILPFDKLDLSRTTRDKTDIFIIQGEVKESLFYAKGNLLESITVLAKSNQLIDNDYIKVFVNDREYKKYEFFTDIPRNAEGCVINTGLSGGVDIFFGTGDFGRTLLRGEIIRVEYLVTNGFSGNWYGSPKETTWEFLEPAYDSLGNEVDLNEVLNVYHTESIVFGANPEDVEFTKIIGNGGSNTNVLANEEKYMYYLRKLNMFSYIDCYTTFNDEYLDDDNIVYLFIIPDIKRKLTTDTNYFTTKLSNFKLENVEKKRLYATLKESGQMQITSEVKIVDPIIRKYGLNIILKVFKGYNIGALRNNIINKLSDYFISVKRRDSIPASDIVALIESIEYIDSVRVQFISERNESAISNGYYFKETYVKGELITEKILLDVGEDPMLGLDEFGDIKIDRNELPIVRGGFYDRNGTYYEEFPSQTGLAGLNIIVKDVIDSDSLSIMNQTNKNRIN